MLDEDDLTTEPGVIDLAMRGWQGLISEALLNLFLIGLQADTGTGLGVGEPGEAVLLPLGQFIGRERLGVIPRTIAQQHLRQTCVLEAETLAGQVFRRGRTQIVHLSFIFGAEEAGEEATSSDKKAEKVNFSKLQI